MIRSSRLSMAALVLAGAAISSTAAVAASSGVKLRVTPTCMKVGQKTVIRFKASGLRPRELVGFSEDPAKPGFGGGNLGLRYANDAGAIRFSQPGAAKYRWEIGRWTVRLYRHKGHHIWVAASVVYRVLPRHHRCS